MPFESMVVASWLLLAFLIGLSAGSFVNVCVARLPLQKSPVWPSSRCLSCYQPVPLWYNVPVLGYLLLRGRCATCGARFSVRYALVELFTGVAFVLLFYFLIFENLHGLPLLKPEQRRIRQLDVPFEALPLVLHHGVLFCFLLVTSLCDLADMEIPLSVTITGTLVGLVFAVLQPWPLPGELVSGQGGPGGIPAPPQFGTYPWPVWYPLPAWLPAGGPLLGLLTGLAGALAGMILVRGIAFLFGAGRGIEGMGLGDADLMMMAGAFIGWQAVILAFFVSVGPALVFAIVHVIRKGNQALPFGPSLACGVMVTLLFWQDIGPQFTLLFFDPFLLGVLAGAGSFILLVTAFLLRLIRGVDEGPEITSGS